MRGNSNTKLHPTITSFSVFKPPHWKTLTVLINFVTLGLFLNWGFDVKILAL